MNTETKALCDAMDQITIALPAPGAVKGQELGRTPAARAKRTIGVFCKMGTSNAKALMIIDSLRGDYGQGE